MKRSGRNEKQAALFQDDLAPAVKVKKQSRRTNPLPVVQLSPGVGKVARGCLSSTAMRYFIEHCPAALKFYREGKPQNTDHFQTGVALHAVLQVIGERGAKDHKAQERIANTVVKELITTGRMYYDEKRPPVQPEYAYAGRDLALQYLAQNELPDGAKYETVLAMDRQGRPCDADSARYRAIIDCFYDAVEGDDDFSCNVIVVRDYKSSWSAGEDELETLQRKSQAVLAAMHFPDKQGVRMEVVNVRTGKVYSKTIFLDDAGKEQLAGWKRDILMLCDATEKTDEARPGAGCKKCPFVESCPDAEKLASAAKNAEALAILDAKRKLLITTLKAQLDDSDGVRLADGYIGYKKLPASAPSDEAPYQILGMWYNTPLSDVPHILPKEVGLLRAMKLGATQIENIAKTIFNGDGKTAKEDFIKLCLKEDSRREFSVWPASKDELDKMNLIKLSGRARKISNMKSKSKTKKAA